MNRKRFKIQGAKFKVARCMSEEGFTLVELLVSASLSLFVLGVVYSVYRVQTRTVKSQESRLVATEDARAALDMMVREIRNAGYNPNNATSGANCAGGGPGAPGVVQANATTFRFTYDFRDGTAVVPLPPPADGNCDDLDEDITYQYQVPGPQACPAGFGDIVRIANGATAPITNCNVPSAAGNFSFVYYPQQTGAAAPPPYCFPDGTPAGCVGPLNLATVQRVLISLTVRSASPDTQFGGGQLNATLTSNADLRNRGLPQ